MKKILFPVTALFLLFALSSAAQQTEVPAEVQSAFNTHFKNAQMARWVAIQDSHVATFSMDGQTWRDAYFTNDGEFKGVGHYITSGMLPISVQEKLNADYGNYETIELYQFDGTESGICFFANLKNDKNKLTLKLEDTGYVAYSQKDRIKQIKKVSEPLAAAEKKH